MQGEHHWHARIGTGALVLITWTGIVVNFIEWKEAVRIARDEQVRVERVVGEARQELKELQVLIYEVKGRKDDLPARLEERMKAMQEQLNRIEAMQQKRRW